ncbi:hypothetical protein F7725_014967, partial [Dissostichus mawsoni]
MMFCTSQRKTRLKPGYFEPILNFLRHGQLIINEGINPLGVLEEARFFGIEQLAEQLRPSSRVHQISACTTTKSELRCQGLNFNGADLCRANLKGVDMEGSQMTGINLRVATLKNAKLKNCNLRGANTGRNRPGANLRGSNVKGAIFEEMLTPLHMSQSV